MMLQNVSSMILERGVGGIWHPDSKLSTQETKGCDASFQEK